MLKTVVRILSVPYCLLVLILIIITPLTTSSQFIFLDKRTDLSSPHWSMINCSYVEFYTDLNKFEQCKHKKDRGIFKEVVITEKVHELPQIRGFWTPCLKERCEILYQFQKNVRNTISIRINIHGFISGQGKIQLKLGRNDESDVLIGQLNLTDHWSEDTFIIKNLTQNSILKIMMTQPSHPDDIAIFDRLTIDTSPRYAAIVNNVNKYSLLQPIIRGVSTTTVAAVTTDEVNRMRSTSTASTVPEPIHFQTTSNGIFQMTSTIINNESTQRMGFKPSTETRTMTSMSITTETGLANERKDRKNKSNKAATNRERAIVSSTVETIQPERENNDDGDEGDGRTEEMDIVGTTIETPAEAIPLHPLLHEHPFLRHTLTNFRTGKMSIGSTETSLLIEMIQTGSTSDVVSMTNDDLKDFVSISTEPSTEREAKSMEKSETPRVDAESDFELTSAHVYEPTIGSEVDDSKNMSTTIAVNSKFETIGSSESEPNSLSPEPTIALDEKINSKPGTTPSIEVEVSSESEPTIGSNYNQNSTDGTNNTSSEPEPITTASYDPKSKFEPEITNVSDDNRITIPVATASSELEPNSEPEPTNGSDDNQNLKFEPTASSEQDPTNGSDHNQNIKSEPTASSEPEANFEPEPTNDSKRNQNLKSEPTASSEPEAHSEPEPTIGSDHNQNLKSESTASSEPEAHSEPEPTNGTDDNQNIKSEPTASSEPEPHSEPEPTNGSDHNQNIKTEPTASSEPEPTNGSEHNQNLKSEPTASSESEANSEPEPTNASDDNQNLKSEPTASSEPEANSEPEPTNGSDHNQNLKSESTASSEPEPTNASDHDQNLKSDSTASSEPEAHTEPEPTNGSDDNQNLKSEPTAASEPEAHSEPEPTNGSDDNQNLKSEPTASFEPEANSEPEPTAGSDHNKNFKPEPTGSTEPEGISEPEPTVAAESKLSSKAEPTGATSEPEPIIISESMPKSTTGSEVIHSEPEPTTAAEPEPTSNLDSNSHSTMGNSKPEPTPCNEVQSTSKFTATPQPQPEQKSESKPTTSASDPEPESSPLVKPTNGYPPQPQSEPESKNSSTHVPSPEPKTVSNEPPGVNKTTGQHENPVTQAYGSLERNMKKSSIPWGIYIGVPAAFIFVAVVIGVVFYMKKKHGYSSVTP